MADANVQAGRFIAPAGGVWWERRSGGSSLRLVTVRHMEGVATVGLDRLPSFDCRLATRAVYFRQPILYDWWRAMQRYKGRYRIESARLPTYDYRSPGWYHVVICTAGRACMLGEVRQGIMGLTVPGCIVAHEWQRTPAVRPYVRLGPWIVMPNHVHLLVGITSATPASSGSRMSTTLRAHSLGAIMGQFKARCTKRIRQRGFHAFGWQSRFYDRIIRTDQEWQALARYIDDNPRRWAEDRLHSGHH